MTGGDLPALPYLAPWYRVVQAEDKVVLEHGQRIVVLEGAAARRLVPAVLALLDGTRTVDEIVRTLGRPSRPAVENVLEVLAGQGVLVEGPPLRGDEPRPFADAAALLASLSPASKAVADAAGALRSCSVAVAGESAAAAEVARLLRSSGVGVERADGPVTGVDLTVCAPAAAELPRLPAWNEQALASALPWLQLLPFDGRYAAVGPLYLPGDTCCHECFRRRRAANLDAGDELALLDRAPASYPAAPAVDALAAAVAAQLALGWLVLGDHYAPAAMYALELVPTIALTVHHVHRVPRCPVCSDVAAESAPLPWHKEIPVAEAARA
jgi:bacteriocin biosynthesis cyclodehydratase domain-containing protein